MNSKYISFEGRKLLEASLKVESTHVDSSFSLADEAMKLAKKAHDTVLIGKIQLHYSYLYYWGKGDYIKTKQVLDTVYYEYYDYLTDSQKCYFYGRLGDAIYYENNFVKSIEYYFKALEFSDNDSNRQGRIYHNIAWVYADMRLFDKAIKYGLIGLDIRRKINSDVSHSLEGMVYVYQLAKMYDDANKCLKEIYKLRSAEMSLAYYYYKKAALYGMMNSNDSALYFAEQGVADARRNDQKKMERYICRTL